MTNSPTIPLTRNLTNPRTKEVSPIAVFSNEIIKSSYNLTLTEHRILKHFVSKIKSKAVIDPTLPHIIEVTEFAHLWGLRGSDVRSELANSCKTLFLRYIFQGSLDGSYAYARWVHSFRYDKPSDTFSIKWSTELIEHISLHIDHFTTLDLKEMVDFKSSYTFRLYELLVSLTGHNKYKNPRLPVETWMYMLDVPESYKEYKTFKSKVLIPCIKELSAKVVKFKAINIKEHKKPLSRTRKIEEIEFTGVGINPYFLKRDEERRNGKV